MDEDKDPDKQYMKSLRAGRLGGCSDVGAKSSQLACYYRGSNNSKANACTSCICRPHIHTWFTMADPTTVRTEEYVARMLSNSIRRAFAGCSFPQKANVPGPLGRRIPEY